jgi:DNA-binding NarL/FixJ family response regulator
MPPQSGLAFVLIPHLDPTHKSLMVDLLGKETRMPVAEAEHGMLIQPNHVYVIPPNKYLAIKQELQGSVIEAIRAVLRDELYLSAKTVRRLAGHTLGARLTAQGVGALSDRELQVFELIGRGHSTREIAQQLKRSVHTIESHREKIRAKLSLRSGSELTQQAVRWVLEADG